MAQPIQEPSPEATTSIDSLLDLLKQKGKVDLNSISISLGVSPRIVEEWAKVLENGKLIKVSYEVGKMFLELLVTGVEPGKGAEVRAEAQKSALQNEMEVEKITLDKFSKNLDDLSSTVAGMEGLYRQKLPNIQKLFSELDSMSAPITRKTKELDVVQKAAETYFGQLDKKVDSIFEKISSMEGLAGVRALKQSDEAMRSALSKADMAKSMLIDLEDTRQALYGRISSDIDRQVKEFKAGLKVSLDQIYAELKADAAASISLEKEIKAGLSETTKSSAETERLKKEIIAARMDLIKTHNDFKNRYQKIVNEITQASKGVEQKYETAQRQLSEMKGTLGDVSRLHTAITTDRAELDSIKEALEAEKASVNSIIETLKTIGTLKTMSDAEKAKVVAELNKKSLRAKVKGERINRSLKEASSSLKKQSEGKR